MRSQIITNVALATLVLTLSGCGGGTLTPTGGVNNANTTAPVKTPEQVKNNAPTLTPVFKAYCDAWAKNDEAAMRKVYSADTIKYFDGLMKEEKVKGLLKFLEDEKVTGDQCEVTNEEITGNKAVGTIISSVYPRGLKVEFVNEGGEWKMTNKSPGSVTQTAANSSASKSDAPNTEKK